MERLKVPEFSQGVCGDGAAILRDGIPLSIEEILTLLREGNQYEQLWKRVKAREAEFRAAIIEGVIEDIGEFRSVAGPGIARGITIQRQHYGVEVTECVGELEVTVHIAWEELERALSMRAGRVDYSSSWDSGGSLIDGSIVSSVRS